MAEEFLVSIITPAYNCIETIEETYNSIKKQTYSNWEWIVIEDHSSDGSFDFLVNLSKKDKRIVLLRTNKNSGTAVARNIGIDCSKGRFISFLDADDMWKPNKLEVQIDFMIKNNVPFTYSNYDVLLPSGKIKLFAPKRTSANYKSLLKRNDIGCLTVVYDSAKIDNAYMPLDSLKREDYAAWLDVTKKGVVAIKIDKSLATYRLGNASLTSNKKKMIKFHYRVYRYHEKFNAFKSFYYLIIFMLNKRFSKYN